MKLFEVALESNGPQRQRRLLLLMHQHVRILHLACFADEDDWLNNARVINF